MKSNLIKKLIVCATGLALLAGGLTGCQKAVQDNRSEAGSEKVQETSAPGAEENTVGEAEAKSQTERITYPLEEEVTLSIAKVTDSAITAHYKDISETPFWSAWQEQTGVKLEVNEVADNTAMNLIFAGGELPDIVLFNFGSGYTGGVPAAIEDGIILTLDDYLEYAPDLENVLTQNDLYRKAVTSTGGKLVGFPFIRGDEYLLTSFGMIMRADWLEELGMEVPNTPEELYEVLKAFREEMGAEVPFSANNWAVQQTVSRGLITAGFGLPRGDFYQVDGKVHYGYYEEPYKEVLAYLNRLYEEGLLDPSFATLEGSVQNNNIMEGHSGLTIGSVGSGIGSYLSTMAEKNPDYDLVGVGALTTQDGVQSTGGTCDFPVNGLMAFITPQCKNVEAAVKFLNYGYTEAGSMLFNYGIEGESYTMENGVPVYTGFIMDNQDGWTKQQAMAAYTRSWSEGPFVQEKGYMEQYANLPQQVDAINRWTDNLATDYIMPPVMIAEEDADEFSSLASEIFTYIDEMFIKYVTGLTPLDTFESEYLETLKSMGVERYIELEQNALDEFNAR